MKSFKEFLTEYITEATFDKKNNIVIFSGNINGSPYWFRVEDFDGKDYGYHIAFDETHMPDIDDEWDDGGVGKVKDIISFLKDSDVPIDAKELKKAIKQIKR